MNFWERVDEQLELQNINKKTLALEAGFDPSNITKGIKNNNVPSAETAVKIAKKLGVSVEYLVTGKEPLKNQGNASKSVYFYQKYQNVINALESLPEQKQEIAIKIVEQFEELGKN